MTDEQAVEMGDRAVEFFKTDAGIDAVPNNPPLLHRGHLNELIAAFNKLSSNFRCKECQTPLSLDEIIDRDLQMCESCFMSHPSYGA